MDNRAVTILVARTAFIVMGIVAVGAGCWRGGIRGNGIIQTTNPVVTAFTGVTVSGAYEIQWSSGRPALTITTDQNLIPLIRTEVIEGTLHIESDNLRPTKGILITISCASLGEVQLDGAVKFTARQVSGGNLKLEANGASNISIDGSVTNLEVNLSGASKLDARSLMAQTASVSASGACYGDVTVTGTLSASISGAGVLTYAGNPVSVEKDVSGAAAIRAR